MQIHSLLASQYHAALEMLKQSVIRCPSEMWNDPQDRNKFWHVAYHALFYTSLYLHPTLEDFKPFAGHRQDYENLGPRPDSAQRTPDTGEPYTQGEILEFMDLCWKQVDSILPALDLEGASGFFWQPINKLEMLLYNLRHLQQHTGELMERLGSRAGVDINWQGSIP